MISTNVIGLSMCTREAVQDMAQRGVNGHIVNIGDLGSDIRPSEGFYKATKAAVRSLTETLRDEVSMAASSFHGIHWCFCFTPKFILLDDADC